MRKTNQKGFTLLEMLIVIAIIAVLVSIIVPVIGNATTRAKAAADAANLRIVLSEATTDLFNGMPPGCSDTSGNVTIKNQGGLISIHATLPIKLKSRTFPDAGLYVSNDGDEVMVAFQVYATYTGDKYYTIEDFARAAEGQKLKATGRKLDNPNIGHFP